MSFAPTNTKTATPVTTTANNNHNHNQVVQQASSSSSSSSSDPTVMANDNNAVQAASASSSSSSVPTMTATNNDANKANNNNQNKIPNCTFGSSNNVNLVQDPHSWYRHDHHHHHMYSQWHQYYYHYRHHPHHPHDRRSSTVSLGSSSGSSSPETVVNVGVGGIGVVGEAATATATATATTPATTTTSQTDTAAANSNPQKNGASSKASTAHYDEIWKQARTTVVEQLKTEKDKKKELALVNMANAEILRGITMRHSGRWQAQTYYQGKSRYIGVFDSREEAALAHELVRRKVKSQERQQQQQQGATGTLNHHAPTSVDNFAGIAPAQTTDFHVIDLQWETVKSKAHALVKEQQAAAVAAATDKDLATKAKAKQTNGEYLQRESFSSTNLLTSKSANNSNSSSSNDNNINKVAANVVTIPFISRLPCRKWKAEIPYGDKVRCIGCFDTREHAITAYEFVQTSLNLSRTWMGMSSSPSSPSATVDSRMKMSYKTQDNVQLKLCKGPIATTKETMANSTINTTALPSNRGASATSIKPTTKASEPCQTPEPPSRPGMNALLMVAKNNDVLNERPDHVFRLLDMAIQNEKMGTVLPPQVTTGPAGNKGDSLSSYDRNSAPQSGKRKREIDPSSSSTAARIAQEKWEVAKADALNQVKVMATARKDDDEDLALDPPSREEHTVPRGICQRGSGKWQAQLFFEGQMRYIGVFESKPFAAMAYEIVRKQLRPNLAEQFEFAKTAALEQLTMTSSKEEVPVAAKRAKMKDDPVVGHDNFNKGIQKLSSNKWHSKIYFGGKNRSIGIFDTQQTAGRAYDIVRSKLNSTLSL